LQYLGRALELRCLSHLHTALLIAIRVARIDGDAEDYSPECGLAAQAVARRNGMIGDLRACTTAKVVRRLRTRLCKVSASPCLGESQIQALVSLQAEVRDRSGHMIYPSFPSDTGVGERSGLQLWRLRSTIGQDARHSRRWCNGWSVSMRPIRLSPEPRPIRGGRNVGTRLPTIIGLRP
jgi:hypothetical protein